MMRVVLGDLHMGCYMCSIWFAAELRRFIKFVMRLCHTILSIALLMQVHQNGGLRCSRSFQHSRIINAATHNTWIWESGMAGWERSFRPRKTPIFVDQPTLARMENSPKRKRYFVQPRIRKWGIGKPIGLFFTTPSDGRILNRVLIAMKSTRWQRMVFEKFDAILPPKHWPCWQPKPDPKKWQAKGMPHHVVGCFSSRVTNRSHCLRYIPNDSNSCWLVINTDSPRCRDSCFAIRTLCHWGSSCNSTVRSFA